jgi:hypothetical protein
MSRFFYLFLAKIVFTGKRGLLGGKVTRLLQKGKMIKEDKLINLV